MSAIAKSILDASKLIADALNNIAGAIRSHGYWLTTPPVGGTIPAQPYVPYTPPVYPSGPNTAPTYPTYKPYVDPPGWYTNKIICANGSPAPIPVLCTEDTCKIGCTVPPLNHGISSLARTACQSLEQADGLSHTD